MSAAEPARDRPSDAPLAARSAPQPRSRILTVLVALVVGLAPIEGYLLCFHPHLPKLAPALLILTWTSGLLREGRLPRLPTANLLVLLLIGCVFASSAGAGSNPYALTYTVRWVPFLVIAFVLVDLLSAEVAPRVVLIALACGAVVAGAGAVASFLWLGAARANGPMEDPNDLAATLAAAVAPLLVATHHAPRGRIRVLAYAGVLIVLGGTGLTFSRGGLLALGAVLVWAVLRRLVGWRELTAAAGLASLALAALAVFAHGQLTVSVEQKQYIAVANVERREMRWTAAFKQIYDRPLLGVGPGGNRHHYVSYSDNAEPAEPTPVTHNMYIEVASELGLVAFTAFMVLIGLSATGGALGGSFRPERLAVEGSMLATLVASAFLSQEYYMPLWVAIAVGGALRWREEEDLSP